VSLREAEEKACAYYFLVDDFRNTTLGLIRSHFKQAGDDGRASRIEVLPVSWHGALHGEETGIDKQLQNITLKSIPRLRHFTNDTLLDILFYTSPVYCQVGDTEEYLIALETNGFLLADDHSNCGSRDQQNAPPFHATKPRFQRGCVPRRTFSRLVDFV
jgi:hypothetical protein